MGNLKYRSGIHLLVVSCLVAAGLSPALATPTQTPTSSEMQVQIQALAARQLEELGIPEDYLPFLGDGPKVRTGRGLYAEPAPDLAGDGAPEVLEVDLRYSYTIGDGQQQLPSVNSQVDTRLSVRSGRNGRKLWGKRFDQDAWPVAMRLGKSGEQGVLVITGLWNFFGTTEERILGLQAFDGRGKPLWSREYRSVSYQDMLVSITEDAPLIVATLDAVEGRSEDLLISLATTAGTLFTQTMTTRALIVDGRTGAETLHPLVDVGVEWWPIPLPTHDLDGDGLDDYATTNRLGFDLGEGQDPPELGGTVYARKGTDGSPIWTTSGLEMEIFGFTRRLPQVVGDGTPDLALQTYVEREVPLVPNPAPLPMPLPLPTSFRYKDRVYLFDGNDGRMRWHKPSQWVYSSGDIDRDGKADLMLGNFRVRFAKGRTILEQLALRGEGLRLWKRDSVWRFETVPCPKGLCFGGWGFYFDPTPDFQPDGVNDLLFGQEVQQNEAWRDNITRAFNGRTGKMTFQDKDILQTAGVAIDGRGTDLLAFEYDANRVEMSARNGSNKTLWDGVFVSSEKILPRESWFYGVGFRLPGDRCGDLVVNGMEEDDSFYAIFDGADGSILWSRWTAPRGERMTWKEGRDLNASC